MKKLLFITWDGPQTFYMEGLFMPIFAEIKKYNPHWEFHVMQFTWGDQQRIGITQQKAIELGIHYQSIPIFRKPVATLGSFISLFLGTSKIKKYIQQHQIDVVMPRSTFPAYMVNKLLNNGKVHFTGKVFQVIFDADGLPIEERVDFAGLKKNSAMYNFLKNTETQMLLKADRIMTRSQKAIEFHLQNIGEEHRSKFSVVFNGRDERLFRFDEDIRLKVRKELGINEERLFVYAGSLGPQYCLPEMLEIFHQFAKSLPSKFLILTGNLDFAQSIIPDDLKSNIILQKVDANEVPNYLSAADVGFALRESKTSMQGVAPIKLGEYLLSGLPVIASKGIGDSEEILKNFSHCLLVDHTQGITYEKIQNYLKNLSFEDRLKIAQQAQHYFSLEAAAKSYLRVLDHEA